MDNIDSLLDRVHWNSQGLVPAIAQDWENGEVLMLAWMNREALARTLEQQRAVYWSRSRQALWHKGEASGNIQILKELRLDCDMDTILMRVEQVGGVACHTGRRHCFFFQPHESGWRAGEPVLREPADLYGNE